MSTLLPLAELLEELLEFVLLLLGHLFLIVFGLGTVAARLH